MGYSNTAAQKQTTETGNTFSGENAQRKMAAVPVLQKVEGEEELPIQGVFVAQRQAPEQDSPTQKKPNNTGMPDNLKAGVENLSGFSMDAVKVHYNSAKPAQLQALAYAQGTDIHVAPGQEKHLPHEAWHVVQQMQGRVQPTMQMKEGVAVNDDKGLENEADVMGGKAVQKIMGEYNNRAIVNSITQKQVDGEQGGNDKKHKSQTQGIIREMIKPPLWKKASSFESIYYDRNVTQLSRIYSRPHFHTGKANKDWTKREREILLSHYAKLGAQWDALIKMESKYKIHPKLKPETITKRNKKMKQIKASKTEVIGEANASNAILKMNQDNNLNWRMLSGFNKGVGFDQVWQQPDGTICIIEAKGPGATLGSSAAKGKQMSKTWVTGTAEGMARSKDKNTHDLGELILTQPKDKVKGYVITSTTTGIKAKAGWSLTPINYD